MHPIKHIGRYTIITKIGYGGMSSVFRALDPQSGNDVAFKFLQDNLANYASSKLRFEQEARLLLGVRHPAIVPLLDFGEEAGRMYLVMPYMPNDSLNHRLANGRLPLDEVIPILERVAAALDEAHARNIIHRDIKPQNILLDSSGAAYLSDFGVARLLDGDQPEKTMTLIGTPDYMAPEQINEGNLSPQTDIYQLGVTLFKMLTGTTPYKGSIHNLMTQHLQAPIPSAESLNRSLPAGCDAVLRKAMAKSPNQRFASASDLVAALEQVRTADAVGTMNLGPRL